MTVRAFKVIVIGGSTGGYDALKAILTELPGGFPLPIVVVIHVGADSGGLLPELLARSCAMEVCEAEDKLDLKPGRVHVAPAGYHLLLEADATLSLSVDGKVCGVRPSVDVLFESAALAFGPRVLGVVLSGANEDGAAGARAIADAGGMTLAQDPGSARAQEMPAAAVAAGGVSHVIPLSELGARLRDLVGGCKAVT